MSKETKKPPFWLLKNSQGDKDGMWTLTVIAFFATTFAYLTSIFEVFQIGDFMLSFRSFDGLGYAAVVLIPLISGYFGRRYTKSQNEVAVAKAQIYAEIKKSQIATPITKQAEKSADEI